MNSVLQQRLLLAFAQHFGTWPSLWVQAPGRVNLIGEHTDYNDGFVLPCAIDKGTLVAVQARDDAVVRVCATDFDGAVDEFRIDSTIPPNPQAPWANYVRGVLEVLRQRGLPLRGANLAIAGDLPRGAGLSSSASLEVAIAQVLHTLMAWPGITQTDLALIAQRAENSFVGCQCGIMDPLISARGQAGHALLIDCRSLQTRAVPIADNTVVMIVDSVIQRGLVNSAYNQRRQQCEQAALHLGVAALRDADLDLLRTRGASLEAVVQRRARHVISENQRTLDAADALRAGDLPRLGRLMAQSHASLRDDFEITTPAIDQLVHLLQDAIGSAGGARMTGGGFGGCVVALMPSHRVDAARTAVERRYRSPRGDAGVVMLCQPAAGAGPCA